MTEGTRFVSLTQWDISLLLTAIRIAKMRAPIATDELNPALQKLEDRLKQLQETV